MFNNWTRELINESISKHYVMLVEFGGSQPGWAGGVFGAYAAAVKGGGTGGATGGGGTYGGSQPAWAGEALRQAYGLGEVTNWGGYSWSSPKDLENYMKGYGLEGKAKKDAQGNWVWVSNENLAQQNLAARQAAKQAQQAQQTTKQAEAAKAQEASKPETQWGWNPYHQWAEVGTGLEQARVPILTPYTQESWVGQTEQGTFTRKMTQKEVTGMGLLNVPTIGMSDSEVSSYLSGLASTKQQFKDAIEADEIPEGAKYKGIIKEGDEYKWDYDASDEDMAKWLSGLDSTKEDFKEAIKAGDIPKGSVFKGIITEDGKFYFDYEEKGEEVVEEQAGMVEPLDWGGAFADFWGVSPQELKRAFTIPDEKLAAAYAKGYEELAEKSKVGKTYDYLNGEWIDIVVPKVVTSPAVEAFKVSQARTWDIVPKGTKINYFDGKVYYPNGETAQLANMRPSQLGWIAEAINFFATPAKAAPPENTYILTEQKDTKRVSWDAVDPNKSKVGVINKEEVSGIAKPNPYSGKAVVENPANWQEWRDYATISMLEDGTIQVEYPFYVFRGDLGEPEKTSTEKLWVKKLEGQDWYSLDGNNWAKVGQDPPKG